MTRLFSLIIETDAMTFTRRLEIKIHIIRKETKARWRKTVDAANRQTLNNC